MLQEQQKNSVQLLINAAKKSQASGVFTLDEASSVALAVKVAENLIKEQPEIVEEKAVEEVAK